MRAIIHCMLMCRIKSSATLQYVPNYCHPHKFVPMWHSAERFAPWCFIMYMSNNLGTYNKFSGTSKLVDSLLLTAEQIIIMMFCLMYRMHAWGALPVSVFVVS